MRNQWEESRSGVRERKYEPRKQSAELLVSYFILSLSSQDPFCQCEFQSLQMARISSLELKATFSLHLYNCRHGGFTFRLIQITATKMTVGRKHKFNQCGFFTYQHWSFWTEVSNRQAVFSTVTIWSLTFLNRKPATFSQEMLQKHPDCFQHH